MYNTNCFLMTDFYKATHLMQYDKSVVKLTSYLTPRSSRLGSEGITHVSIFGLALFCNKYLTHIFEEQFFSKDFCIIKDEIYHALGIGLGYNINMCDATIDRVRELWELNYLPIIISGLPEGSLCPMGVPAVEITTTHPKFAWVGQAIESLLSCSIWHPMISATIAREYAKIGKAAYNMTSDGDYRKGMCDFSMRGQESYESAVASSMGWLTAFDNSSTVDAGFWIKDTYGGQYDIHGLTSTEHSVMCTDAALHNGDEKETYRRLLTEVYPKTSFAAVCDSYDFWNVVTNILPSLTKEIEAHEGFIGIRHDSDEPVHALCGIPTITYEVSEEMENYADYIAEVFSEEAFSYSEDKDINGDYFIKIVLNNNIIHHGVYHIEAEYGNERGGYTDEKYYFVEGYNVNFLREEPTWEDMGMVEALYKLFGGTKNSKGYITLNPHVKAVYGDSITIPRAKAIYERLAEKGFAADCVSLGVGSFSMQCIECKDGTLAPFTRDTFSIAIKATYGKYINNEGKEEEFFIFKSPKNFNRKRSQRGLCAVYYDEKINDFNYIDNLTEVQRDDFPNYEKPAYVTYFDGNNYMTKKSKATIFDFNEIRSTVSKSL